MRLRDAFRTSRGARPSSPEIPSRRTDGDHAVATAWCRGSRARRLLVLGDDAGDERIDSRDDEVFAAPELSAAINHRGRQYEPSRDGSRADLPILAALLTKAESIGASEAFGSTGVTTQSGESVVR
jgi:hypothetical protein